MTEKPNQKKIRLLVGAGLILLAVLISYIPAINGGYIWDDDEYVTDNTNLRDLEGLKRTWFTPSSIPQYYPLTHTTFWIEYHLWELDPMGYHVVNVLLHVASALLLWLLLSRLGVPGAFLAAAVFALHPVHVESVAWITERKNVLSGLFYLAAFLAYLRFAGVGTGGTGGTPGDTIENPEAHRNWRYYAFALVLFVSALLSKTVTSTLPAAILLVIWWKRPRLKRRDIMPLVPFFAIGMTMGLLTAWMEKFHVGAMGQEWDFSIIDRVLIAGRVMWFYAGKLFFPYPLTFIYERWTIDSGVWWQYLFPLAAAGVVAALWLLRHRIGKGALVAVLFFAGTLLPALGFFDVYPMRFSFVADHFQYLASIGLIVLGCAVLVTLLSRAGWMSRLPAWMTGTAAGPGTSPAASPRKRPWGVFICAPLLLTLGALTWNQGYVYKDVETLWRDTLKKNKTAAIAYINLGIEMKARGKLAEAVELLEKAVGLKPKSAKAHYNLANILKEDGRYAGAIYHYMQALSFEPNHRQALINLGNSLGAKGRFEEAMASFQKARKLNPGNPDIYYNMGGIAYFQGRLAPAESYYRKALELRPGFARAHPKLGVVFLAPAS